MTLSAPTPPKRPLAAGDNRDGHDVVRIDRVAHPEEEIEDKEREHEHLNAPPLGEIPAASGACDQARRLPVAGTLAPPVRPQSKRRQGGG